MHDEFLEKLREAADVSLLARLKDDRIGFPFPNDIRIFIPDLHLISSFRQEEYQFKYNTNYKADDTDLLPRTLQELANFKEKMVGDGKTVEVYQLGDFIDLWRETDKPWRITPDEWEAFVIRIKETNAVIYDTLLNTLHANFVLGNHDFDLHRIPGFFNRWRFLSHYLENEQEVRVVGIMHGDLFSWAEHLPDSIQRFFVFNFSPQEEPPPEIRDKVVGSHLKWNFLGLKKYKNYKKFIMQKQPLLLNPLALPREIPAERAWNIKRIDQGSKKELRFLGAAKNYFFQLNRQPDFNVHVAFMAHTHFARIAVDDSGGDFFVLVDCGDWIRQHKVKVEENGREREIEVKNAQIGVLCDNDIRIYQLAPKAA